MSRLIVDARQCGDALAERPHPQAPQVLTVNTHTMYARRRSYHDYHAGPRAVQLEVRADGWVISNPGERSWAHAPLLLSVEEIASFARWLASAAAIAMRAEVEGPLASWADREGRVAIEHQPIARTHAMLAHTVVSLAAQEPARQSPLVMSVDVAFALAADLATAARAASLDEGLTALLCDQPLCVAVAG